MNSSAIEVIKATDPWIILLIILGLFYIIKELFEASKYFLEAFGLVKREDLEKQETKNSVEEITKELTKINEKIDCLTNEINIRMSKVQTDIDNVMEASREELGDRINTKFKHYFTLGYIPADEYGEFVNLHRAYKSVGGNHSGDAKFKRCEKLKIIDDSPDDINIEHQGQFCRISDRDKNEPIINISK